MDHHDEPIDRLSEMTDAELYGYGTARIRFHRAIEREEAGKAVPNLAVIAEHRDCRELWEVVLRLRGVATDGPGDCRGNAPGRNPGLPVPAND